MTDIIILINIITIFCYFSSIEHYIIAFLLLLKLKLHPWSNPDKQKKIIIYDKTFYFPLVGKRVHVDNIRCFGSFSFSGYRL